MFSATDIANFLACRHTATLARAESKNEITTPFFKNQTVDLLRTLGIEHEQRHLRELTEKGGLSVAEIAVSGNWKDAVAQTVQALRQGVDAVYQGTFWTRLGAAALTFLFGSTLPAPSGRGPTRLWKQSWHAPPRRQRWFSFAFIRTCWRGFKAQHRSGCTLYRNWKPRVVENCRDRRPSLASPRRI
jgi:hypothetical protein